MNKFSLPRFLVGLMAFLLAATGFRPAVAETPPNVLLIMTDDQGWGDLGIHGNPHLDTPVLDQLALDGAQFDRFYVSPVCAPTRASLLTGRYSLRTGVYGVTRGEENMRGEETTVAEVFRRAGYRTGCFGKWHNGAHWPYHPNGQGFEEFVGFCAGHWNNYFNTELEHNGRPLATDGYITDVLTDHALRFIRQESDRPFFCYVPYNAPHSPWQVPQSLYDKYRGQGLEETTACAYAMCENLDTNIGRLLESLEQTGVADSTIVLFLTDNGPNTNRFNGEMRGRKGSVHEGGVRVPLLVRWPGTIDAGRRIDRIAAHIDVLPTLAELCGIDGATAFPLDGISLASDLLKGEAAQPVDRRLLSFRRTGDRGAVRTPRWRAVREGSGWQLFDMLADPDQTEDVGQANGRILEELAAFYEETTPELRDGPFEPLPIQVGHEERPAVPLRGHEAFLHPAPREGISYHGRAGWANDWITNWSDPQAYAYWSLKVVRGGRYEVSLRVACRSEDVGARLVVRAGTQELEWTAEQAYDAPQVPSPDLIPRKEVYERLWPEVVLGTLTLEAGATRLEVHSPHIPGPRSVEIKSVTLRRIEATASESEAGGDRELPNVVLLMADDLGWADVGYRGHPHLQTPHLDAMAAAGLRLDRFYAAAPVCSPTRGSALTGRHPYRYGVFGANTGHLPEAEWTVAELLQAHGYATGHFGKWHLGTLSRTERDSNRGGTRGLEHWTTPSHHGFETYFATEAKVPTWDPMFRPAEVQRNTWWGPIQDPGRAVPYGTAYWSDGTRESENLEGDDSRVIMDRVIPFVRQAVESDRSFLAVVWFHTPHLPVVAGPPYRDRYAEHDDYTRAYFGSVTAMDEQIGRLRSALRELGVAQDTLLWFCSDNGPEGRQGQAPGSALPLRGRKRDLLEGGIRVPGIVEWPAVVAAGRVSRVPAVTSDFLPTLLELLDEDPRVEPLDGVSLLPLLDGDDAFARPRPIGFESAGQLAWIDNRYKVVYRSRNGRRELQQNPPPASGFALYDLIEDPSETHDLSSSLGQRRQCMVEALLSWRSSCDRSRAGADY